METIHILDAKGLEIFKKIARTGTTASQFDPDGGLGPLWKSYLDLEARIFEVLSRLGASDPSVFGRLRIRMDDRDSVWFRCRQRVNSPTHAHPELLTPREIVADIVEVYGVDPLRPMLNDVVRVWRERVLGDDHLVLGLPEEFRSTHGGEGRMSTEDWERETQYIRSYREHVPIHAHCLFEFNNYRHRYGFMRFPVDPEGHSPELELTMRAVSCMPGLCLDHPTYDRSLRRAVAKYLSRLVLCSAGHIVPPSTPRTDLDIRLRPIPGEPNGRPVHNIARMSNECRWCGRLRFGRLAVTKEELELGQGVGRDDRYVRLINS